MKYSEELTLNYYKAANGCDLLEVDNFEDVKKIIEKENEIIEIISNNLVGYTYERLYNIDKAIIIVCIYRMLYSNTNYKICINDAVAITKIYSDLDDQKQHKFTNRLLDNIAKSLGLKANV